MSTSTDCGFWAAFTDEQALLAWTKKPGQYTAMRSQDVLNLAQENNINRIVINNDQPNMFVVERSKGDVKEHRIFDNSQVQTGTPHSPLSNSITEKLIVNFKKNKAITEVYQYAQTRDGEQSIVLGFRLTGTSENARKAAIYSVQDALQNETVDQLLDLFFLETDEWYHQIKEIENALLYKKEGSQ